MRMSGLPFCLTLRLFEATGDGLFLVFFFDLVRRYKRGLMTAIGMGMLAMEGLSIHVS